MYIIGCLVVCVSLAAWQCVCMCVCHPLLGSLCVLSCMVVRHNFCTVVCVIGCMVVRFDCCMVMCAFGYAGCVGYVGTAVVKGMKV